MVESKCCARRLKPIEESSCAITHGGGGGEGRQVEI